ncbi:MAG: primosomal protein N', partial [Bacteroidales bacterium]|nr:primosomal protein N' [Bacteroidales bacterium]
SMSEAEKETSPLPEDTIVLSEAQKTAFESIQRANRPVLLQGVTGSGKTEIYSKLALETLAAGRNVLYLVPEIALSRQLETRLSAVFGDRLLIFHSHETAARRGYAAAKTAENGGYVVLGTRSALFLPHRNLGLIIVDEEHDRSYKQDSPAPRYSGRDVALLLGRRFSSRIVLGSATPSFESLHNCAKGKFEKVVLCEKYYSCEEADVEIIDTVAERKKRGMVGSISRKLIEAMTRTLDSGAQIIVLRNRRAYVPALQCADCGTIVKCPSCNVSLSYHKSSGRMVCHSCGRSWAYDGACHSCGGTIVGLGSGTEKIEEELEALFPEARIARLDSDVAARSGVEQETIKAFAEGHIDILVGTQIITKGFDFPGLKLVAVIDADGMLGVDDFRADERAYDVLQQLRGRASRRGEKGLLMIQTRQPSHPVFSRLAGDGAAEETAMMDERKDFGYPPYTRLVHIAVRAKNEDAASRGAQELCGRLEEAGLNPVGPYSPAAGRVDGLYERALRLSLPRTARLEKMKEALRAAVNAFEKDNAAVAVAIDVDPL